MPDTRQDVLIVDDQAPNLALLSRVLKENGFAVRAVTSGERALDAARLQAPDCVLLDVSMPGMDGYEVCAHFQADEHLSGVPIIYLTAHDDTEHKVRAFASGGRDYISKPFQPEEVVARVQNQLSIKQLEAQLRHQTEVVTEANLKLEEAAQLRSRVTATLLHDIKSPITVMAMVVEGPITESALQDARDAYQKIQRLLDELLELSKKEHVHREREKVSLQVADVVADVVRLTRHVAQARRVELGLSADVDAIPPIHGDRDQLERMFTNLLDNALKFTPAGGQVDVQVATEQGVGVESGLSFVTVSVADSGPGIAAQELPFVFDAYRRAPGSESTRGVGLGLAIAARIVAQHGGRIRVRSQVGVGTEMRVLLPVAPG